MSNPIPLRRLPLKGTQNTRDLGGYLCKNGVTRWHRFVRSDNPRNLAPADIAFLKDYGVSTVVDLRRGDEAAHAPSSLAEAPGFQVVQISLNDDIYGVDYEGDLPGSMAGLYIKLLDGSRPQMAEVVGAMAAAEGGVLFHCAVGKDRTGVIAMLLLDLAGVAEADIVADYAVTDIYIGEMIDEQRRVFKGQLPECVMYSVPASMRRALRHLRETYGDAEAYLTGCGLPPEALAKLRQKLVGPAGL